MAEKTVNDQRISYTIKKCLFVILCGVQIIYKKKEGGLVKGNEKLNEKKSPLDEDGGLVWQIKC